MNLFILNTINDFIKQRFSTGNLTLYKNGLLFQNKFLAKKEQYLFIEITFITKEQEHTFFKTSIVQIDEKNQLNYIMSDTENISIDNVSALVKLEFEINNILFSLSQQNTDEKTEIIDNWLSTFSI